MVLRGCRRSAASASSASRLRRAVFRRPASAEMVEAAGMVVCPGFIDIQSHSIVPLLVDGRCLSKITQGVTTEIMGEGWTPAPIGGRNMDDLRHTPYATLERVAGAGTRLDALRRLAGGDGQGRGSRRMSARSWVAGPCGSTVAAWTWVRSNAAEMETMRSVHGRSHGRWRVRCGLCPDLPARHLRRHR